MGGPTAARDALLICVARMQFWMTETGELDTNKYDELVGAKPVGLEVAGVTVMTRQRWEITRCSEEGNESLADCPWSSVNNCTVTFRLTLARRHRGLLAAGLDNHERLNTPFSPRDETSKTPLRHLSRDKRRLRQRRR